MSFRGSPHILPLHEYHVSFNNTSDFSQDKSNPHHVDSGSVKYE